VKNYSLSHLSDEALLHGLSALVAQDRGTTAAMLAHIAEVDERKLYRPAGYDSMSAYCVGKLRLCEQAARKRIFAARAARRFPAIFGSLADGRLHLSAVVMLAPYLTETTADELLAAASHKTRAEIERLLAERFPRTDVFTWVQPIPVCSTNGTPEQRSPGNVDDPVILGTVGTQLSSGTADVRSRVSPLSSQSYEVQYTMGQHAHDLLSAAQELLSHEIPSGDVAQVVERALEIAVPLLQKRKFAATANPRPCGVSHNPRHIPADVMRAVWERDGGRCTFVSESGHRCESHRRLEFDHVLEVARGGEATVEGLRLRCRAHNQYQAERTFGAEFMRRKREAAAEARAAAKTEARAARERTRAEAQAAREKKAAEARAKAAILDQPHVQEVIPWLQALRCRPDEVKRAAALCADMPEASLEERVRRAVSSLGRACKRH
jgi:5-methylcytosine-specific restriction endonuclease McrA